MEEFVTLQIGRSTWQGLKKDCAATMTHYRDVGAAIDTAGLDRSERPMIALSRRPIGTPCLSRPPPPKPKEAAMQNDAQMPELLPCPFCGGEAKVYGPAGWYRQYGISHSCRVFYGGSGDFTLGAKTEEQAIADWNRRSDLCASGQQVRALVDVATSLAAAISLLERGGKSAKKAAASDKMFDQMLADYRASLERARTALASREPPTAQEAVAWRCKDYADGWVLYGNKRQAECYQPLTGCLMEALYTHPPQPSETVAEAATHALDACRIIDAAVLEGHDSAGDLIRHLLEAVEPARAALRALKGYGHE